MVVFIPTQLYISGNVSWTDEEHGKNASLYLYINYDQNSAINVITLTIMVVILNMALIALIVVGLVKTVVENASRRAFK